MSYASEVTRAIIEENAKLIQEYAGKINCKGLRVSEHILECPVRAFQNMNIGAAICDDNVGFQLATHGARCKGKQLEVLLIPDMLPITFWTDRKNSQVGAKIFFRFDAEEETIVPCVTDLPVRLDCLLGAPAKNTLIPEHIYENNSTIEALTVSKYETKKVLHKARLSVPEFVWLPQNTPGIRKSLENFAKTITQNDIVIKSNTGSGGYEVGLFSTKELSKAVKYAQELHAANKDVLVERRIIPLELIGRDTDWNVRAFVTLEEKPRWADGFVRYSQKSSTPVNICQGAKVMRLDNAGITGKRLEKFQSYACHAARVLSRQVGVREGWLGLDLMLDQSGKVYCLEANTSPGGIAELTMLGEEPPGCVVKILLPSLHKKLLRNHALARNSLDQPLPLSETVRLSISRYLQGRESEPEIAEYLISTVVPLLGFGAEAEYAKTIMCNDCGDIEGALYHARLACELMPERKGAREFLDKMAEFESVAKSIPSLIASATERIEVEEIFREMIEIIGDV